MLVRLDCDVERAYRLVVEARLVRSCRLDRFGTVGRLRFAGADLDVVRTDDTAGLRPESGRDRSRFASDPLDSCRDRDRLSLDGRIVCKVDALAL